MPHPSGVPTHLRGHGVCSIASEKPESTVPFASATDPLALACVLARPFEGQECTYTTVPTARHMRQPDGSAIELYFRGNGKNHWYEDAAGHPVVKTEAGWFYARRGRDGCEGVPAAPHRPEGVRRGDG